MVTRTGISHALRGRLQDGPRAGGTWAGWFGGQEHPFLLVSLAGWRISLTAGMGFSIPSSLSYGKVPVSFAHGDLSV